MWFDGIRQPNTLYVASVSRGKDSTAMLRAIQLLGFPLDVIYSVDIWATQDIPAELPPMVEFKEEWDKRCLDLFGVPVTRICAEKRERESQDAEECHTDCLTKICSTTFSQEGNSLEISKDFQTKEQILDGAKNSKCNMLTFQDIFYWHNPKNAATRRRGIYGFPMRRGNWCNSMLKVSP